MINQELQDEYNAMSLPIEALLDAGDINAAKAYVMKMAYHAEHYEITDLTAYMAINHIRRELIDRNMLEAMQPEWGKAEKIVNLMHKQEQERIQGWFNGRKIPSPYK